MAVYHGAYDMVIIIVVLPLALYLVGSPAAARLSTGQLVLVTLVIAGYLAFLSIPFGILNDAIIQTDITALDQILARIFTGFMLLVLMAMLWLSPRLSRI